MSETSLFGFVIYPLADTGRAEGLNNMAKWALDDEDGEHTGPEFVWISKVRYLQSREQLYLEWNNLTEFGIFVFM